MYEKNTAKWDLNAKIKIDSTSLEKIPDAELPEVLKGKTLKEKKQMLADNQVLRDSTTGKIKEYSRLRDEYVNQIKLNNISESTTQSLGEAIAQAIRTQAAKLGFEFDLATEIKN